MKDKANFIASSVSWFCTLAQTNEVFQLAMLILSIISTIITIANVFIKWYNKAKEDGKITSEELQELGKQLAEEGQNTAKLLKENKEKTEKEQNKHDI